MRNPLVSRTIIYKVVLPRLTYSRWFNLGRKNWPSEPSSIPYLWVSPLKVKAIDWPSKLAALNPNEIE